MRWLLQADRLQASSALPACSAADPVAFGTVWSAFPALWGQPALGRDSSSLSVQNPTFKGGFSSLCLQGGIWCFLAPPGSWLSVMDPGGYDSSILRAASRELVGSVDPPGSFCL